MALKVPKSPKKKTIQYEHLLGCDFSQDGSLVDRRHSPYMLNMISDEGGNPVKRKGWEILAEYSEEDKRKFTKAWPCRILGLDYALVEVDNKNNPQSYDYYIVDAIGNMTQCASFPKSAGGRINNAFSYDADGTGEYLYALTNDEILCIDDEGRALPVVAKDPTIVLSRYPDGTNGKDYEAINLASEYVIEQYLITDDYDGTTTFKLLQTPTDSPNMTIKVRTGDTWADYTGTFTISGNVVTVSDAIAKTDLTGVDNVRIHFKCRTISYHSARNIFGTVFHGFYSKGSKDQVFLGNRQKIWYSEVGDISYWPDINYLEFGGDSNEIYGLLPMGDELAAITGDPYNGHAGIYRIYDKTMSSTTVTTTDSDKTYTKTEEEYTFAVKRLASEHGAIDYNCCAVLGDEPIFLSRAGLYGIISATATGDKLIRNRSISVNRQLIKDIDADDNANVIVNNNYLYVFVNNHAYVFDGRHKTGDDRNNTNYYYEAYYWENMPVNQAFTMLGGVFFINAHKLCKFKDHDTADDYSDGSTLDADTGRQTGGTAIRAIWTTRNDDDNLPQYFKTMQKKGSMVTIAPYEHTSVDVWVIPDGSAPLNGDTTNKYYIGKFIAGLLNFANIDFSKFVFDGRNGPKDYFFQKKRKKYIRLQLMLENNGIDEPFGIYSLTKTYTATRFAKSR